jgi:hypothetical protein
MSGRLLRISVLGAALLFAAASMTSRTQSSPGGPPPTGIRGVYQCHSLASASGSATQCFASAERCQAERQAAQAEGLRVSLCAEVSPVACFQLGGDPNPSQEMCATTIEDCELWRAIDQNKNGTTGAACQLMH